MIVRVKQKHIDKGWPLDQCNCPVALAVKEILGMDSGCDCMLTKQFVLVNDDCIEVWNNGELETKYRATKKLHKFISAFDSGKFVKPTVFKFVKY